LYVGAQPDKRLRGLKNSDYKLGRWHPLRTLIGELGASQTIVWMSLVPLSLDAVKSLAEPFDGDSEMLYLRTGWQPVLRH
jgi:hypothetical protein